MLKLARELLVSSELRIGTLTDAIHLIDRDLPKARRHAPHWRRARETLSKAVRCKKPAEIERATRELERALRREQALIQ